jgi:hypothetical protein
LELGTVVIEDNTNKNAKRKGPTKQLQQQQQARLGYAKPKHVYSQQVREEEEEQSKKEVGWGETTTTSKSGPLPWKTVNLPPVFIHASRRQEGGNSLTLPTNNLAMT